MTREKVIEIVKANGIETSNYYDDVIVNGLNASVYITNETIEISNEFNYFSFDLSDIEHIAFNETFIKGIKRNTMFIGNDRKTFTNIILK